MMGVAIVACICIIGSVFFSIHHFKRPKRTISKELARQAARYANGLEFNQFIDGLLLIAHNDTLKLCCVFEIPKNSLIRLALGETYPTNYAKEIFVTMFQKALLWGPDCLNEYPTMTKNSKSLLDGEINRKPNPIWEKQQCE